MENKVLDIIKNVTDYQEITLDSDIDLIESNILDSLAFIELITSLEEGFDIEIQPTQVNPDVWRKVQRIIKFVKEKIGS